MNEMRQEEVLAFLTQVMRGGDDDAGKAPTMSERLKAADALMRHFAGEEKSMQALSKLDELLREFRHAVDEQTE